MATDFELLSEFVHRGSESAFTELVQRHGGMVTATALRILGNTESAEEICQNSFMLLAQKAGNLKKETIVAGWLYNTARFQSLEKLRKESRQQRRDIEYASMNQSSENEAWWQQIQPFLDEAMKGLKLEDQNALVLRFFEGKTFMEVATALGTNEGAAKMRITRALEKLQKALERSKIAIAPACLLAAMASASAAPMPQQTAAGITETALNNSALTDGGKSFDAPSFTSALKLKLITAAVVLLVCAGVIKSFVWSSPANSISSLSPMAGEWQGTLHTTVQKDKIEQPVHLVITTSTTGKECEILLHILPSKSGPTNSYKFVHRLNKEGTAIQTEDDPQIGKLLGEGEITKFASKNGEWSVRFVNRYGTIDGATECQWVRKNDELFIEREDSGALGRNKIKSELRLHKKT